MTISRFLYVALALGVALVLAMAWGYRTASPNAVRAFQLRSAAASVGNQPIGNGSTLGTTGNGSTLGNTGNGSTAGSSGGAVGQPAPIDAGGLLLDAGPAPGDGGVPDGQGQPLTTPGA